MDPVPVTLEQLARFLDERLEARAYDSFRGRGGRPDQNGIYRDSRRKITRLTLALEPWPGFGQDIRARKSDACFLHRPWRMTPEEAAALEEHDAGVLAYHLSFDEHLTLGFNPGLAAALGLSLRPEPLGFKGGRAIGMLGRYAAPRPVADALAGLRAEFAGLESEETAGDQLAAGVEAVALVGAMTDALVREAHRCGAKLYVTGQRRQPAAAAVRETGMAVAEVGHQRSEVWGLHALAVEIRACFGITATVAEPPRCPPPERNSPGWAGGGRTL